MFVEVQLLWKKRRHKLSGLRNGKRVKKTKIKIFEKIAEKRKVQGQNREMKCIYKKAIFVVKSL